MIVIKIGPRQRQMSGAKFNALMEHKRAMSRRPTKGEKRFKLVLKRLGIKFKTQRLFIDAESDKGYIADFYIPTLSLAFEIDGPSHNSPFARDYDAVRTSFLSSRGVKVARISNEGTLDTSTCERWVLEQVEGRKAELDERARESRAAKRDPREQRSTPQEKREDMMREYFASGGKITKCPTVERKNRKIRR